MAIRDAGGEIGTWVGEELRREVFFFESGGLQIYGSLYAAAQPSRTFGVAICNSWGFEGNQASETMHAIALAAARAGGAGAIFHYPGFGDSQGSLTEVSMETLVSATTDFVSEVSRRQAGMDWVLAGLMMGGSVAALAAAPTEVKHLLLVQPELMPSRYFARLERSARRAAARVPARAGNAYGYPLPPRILDAAESIDNAVGERLSEFDGHGALVRYAEPLPSEPLPPQFEEVVVPGAWRFGMRQKPHLAEAASRWLDSVGVEAAP